MYGRALVSLLQWHEDLDRVVVIADAAHEQRALHAIVSFGLAPRASPPVKTRWRTPGTRILGTVPVDHDGTRDDDREAIGRN